MGLILLIEGACCIITAIQDEDAGRQLFLFLLCTNIATFVLFPSVFAGAH